ncbi:hypothetical protein evm_006957 [Chilo suppressalis]|nr:hypothetical protein evm_006957 [Chilo suppressalis]
MHGTAYSFNFESSCNILKEDMKSKRERCTKVAYEQTAHLMVSDHRRPWTLATPGVSQMRCRHLRKEYALFLKSFGLHRLNLKNCSNTTRRRFMKV